MATRSCWHCRWRRATSFFALVAFLGGLSASTAMVIVECVALSIMVCNNLVVPLLLRRRGERSAVHENMGETLILIRRTAIFFVLGLAYAYYRMIGVVGGAGAGGALVVCRRGAVRAGFLRRRWCGSGRRRAGAMWGITAGFAVWLYTLLLPSFADAGWIGRGFLDNGPFGLGLLQAPHAVRHGIQPAHPRRDLEPAGQCHRLCGAVR